MSELTTHWYRSWGPGEQRRLHWYVLPPASHAATAQRAQVAVDRRELRPIPGPWLHCTVVSVRNTNEVSLDDRRGLLEAGRATVRDLAPFDTPVGRPAVWGEAVVYDLSPCPELSAVQQRLLDVSEPFLAAPRPERYVPHITFCYAHDSGDAGPTEAALDDESLVLPSFRVDTVWLLDVLREPGPEKGWYSWDIVGSASLEG